MNNIQIKSLEGISPKSIHASWTKAFSDYSVNIQWSEGVLATHFKQNSVRLEASVGAFDGGELVGLWMNGIRTTTSGLAAYDAGTAIWPEYRGKGLSKSMAEKSSEILKNLGVTEYVLEVISDNIKAYNVYLKDGFRVTRHFVCFRTKETIFNDVLAPFGVTFSTPPVQMSSLNDLPSPEFSPSWQNSVESILAASDTYKIIKAEKNGKTIGYGIIQSTRARIAQIGFVPEAWETNIPSIILRKMCETAGSDAEVAMVNVEETAAKTIALLTRHGFQEFVRQYEMSKRLS